MTPEIDLYFNDVIKVSNYLDSRPNITGIFIQPGRLWNADGEAVFLRGTNLGSGLPGDSRTFLLCSDEMLQELVGRGLLKPQEVLKQLVQQVREAISKLQEGTQIDQGQVVGTIKQNPGLSY